MGFVGLSSERLLIDQASAAIEFRLFRLDIDHIILVTLAIYREKFPDRYVENYAMLARVVRLEADVKHSLATPKTVGEALDQLESKVGKDGRQKFEKFLRSIGEDLDDQPRPWAT
jgi:hypothetical protein